MTELDHYLAKHYLNGSQLQAAGVIRPDQHDILIGKRLVPAPSYVVTEDGTLRSCVFGEMPAPGAKPGSYFHPAQAAWIARARLAIFGGGIDDAEARLRARFTERFGAALASHHRTTWRMGDSFDDEGRPLPGLAERTVAAWQHFLNGTFGLCVANPLSEAHIAHKEVLQEKLTKLSANGARTSYTPDEAAALRELIDAYAAAAMPFAPPEYPLSSRKRLVDDLRAFV